MRRRAAICLSLALLAATAGATAVIADEPGSNERIIAGTKADPAAWPAISALYFKPVGSRREFQICGSTVIAPRYVLTAAHCVVDTAPARLAVVVGRPDLGDESVGQRIRVADVEVDPGYRPPFFRGDLAVLELRRDAPVTPAALASKAEDAAVTQKGAAVRVAGWGATRPSGGKPSRVLLTASETVIAERACKRFYRGGFEEGDQICVRGARVPGEGLSGSCYGDSGGPLMADTIAGPRLIGVVSGGGDRCVSQPEYYSRVAAGLNFIRKASGVVPVSP